MDVIDLFILFIDSENVNIKIQYAANNPVFFYLCSMLKYMKYLLQLHLQFPLLLNILTITRLESQIGFEFSWERKSLYVLTVKILSQCEPTETL